MRHVQRGPEPPDLTAFKAAANADWTPRYRDLDKKPVRAALAREQGFLCGYCGSRIGQREGDCHIEHVEAQSKNASRELDYANMLGSCQGSDATPQVPEHCGQARGNVPLPVTPFMPGSTITIRWLLKYSLSPSIDAKMIARPFSKPLVA